MLADLNEASLRFVCWDLTAWKRLVVASSELKKAERR